MGRTSAELHLAGCPKDMSAEDAAAILSIVDCLDNIIEVTDWDHIQAAWVAKDSTGESLLLQTQAYGRFYAKRDEWAKWLASQSDRGEK